MTLSCRIFAASNKKSLTKLTTNDKFNPLNAKIMNRTVYQEAIATRNATSTQSELSKMQQYRLQLKSITNRLRELAEKSGRPSATSNQLLRECYNLTNTELDTFEGWTAKGGHIRKGQHAYLFWGKRTQSSAGYDYFPVQFLFAREQVAFAV